MLLLNWINYSPRCLSVCEQLIDPMISILEKRVGTIAKKFPNSERTEEMKKMIKLSLKKKGNFEININNFLKRYHPTSIPVSERDDFRSQDLASCAALTRKDDSNCSGEREGSTTSKLIGRNNQIRIPILNIPSLQKETTYLISRSTRRLEFHNKSSMSTSNRLTNVITDPIGGPGRSRESSANDKKNSTNYEGNLSYLDENESVNIQRGYDNFKSTTRNIGASEIMRNLGTKMGEYFLAIDLGCLLEQKRKLQMEEVAKFTGQHDNNKEIESVMYNSRSCFESNEHDYRRSNFFDQGLLSERNINPEDRISSDEEYDAIEELQKIRRQGPTLQSTFKKIIKGYQKNTKVILNILLKVLWQVNTSELEKYEWVLPILETYISSIASKESRDRESISNLSSLKYWIGRREHKFHASNELLDGVYWRPKASGNTSQALKSKMTSSRDTSHKAMQFESAEFSVANPKNDPADSKILSHNDILSDTDALFEIINIFGHVNEQKTGFIRNNLTEFFAESFIGANEQKKIPSKNYEDLTMLDSRSAFYIPKIKGISILQYGKRKLDFFKNNSYPLLNKIVQTLKLLLAHCPLTSQHFFLILEDQLYLLTKLISTSTSRIVMYEFIEKILHCLISVKCIFWKITESELTDNILNTVSRKNSPRFSNKREDYSLSNFNLRHDSIDFSTSNANQHKATYLNLKGIMAYSERDPTMSTGNLMPNIFNQGNTILARHKKSFCHCLEIISQMAIRSKIDKVFEALCEIFFLEEGFGYMVELSARFLFSKISDICKEQEQSIEESGLLQNNDDPPPNHRMRSPPVHEFKAAELVFFQCAKQAIEYYKSQVIMCKRVVEELKLNDREMKQSDLKKKWKSKIRRIFSSINSMINPKNGILMTLISSSSSLIAKLSKMYRLESIKENEELAYNINIQFNLYCAILELIRISFSLDPKWTGILTEENASHYIRFCYVHFIETYSHISHNEMLEINKKIMRKISKKNPDQTTPDEKKRRHKKSFPILLSKLYLKILVEIANNRNSLVPKIFYQFRIMEFLYKEINLEFEIVQIKQEFLDIQNKARIQQNGTQHVDTFEVLCNTASFLKKEPHGLTLDLARIGVNVQNSVEDENIRNHSKLSEFKEDSKISFKRLDFGNEEQRSQHSNNDIPQCPNSSFRDSRSNRVSDNMVSICSGDQSDEEMECLGSRPPHLNLNLNLCAVQGNNQGVEPHAYHHKHSLYSNSNCSKSNEDNSSDDCIFIPENSNEGRIPGFPNMALNLNLTKLGVKEGDRQAHTQPQGLNLQLPLQKIHAPVKISPIAPFETPDIGNSKSGVPMLFSAGKPLFGNSPAPAKPKGLDLPLAQLLKDKPSLKMSHHEAITANAIDPNLDAILDENVIYYSERKLRKLYDDDELHSLCVSLMLSLIIKTSSGVLEDRYCGKLPIDEGKPNYLHILHYHLNHSSNRAVIPLVQKQLSDIKPYPAGQRLLKLLCKELNDLSIYSNLEKIGVGQYGMIYSCNTGMSYPEKAAIKKIPFNDDIFGRSVLYDIFSEISCLEYFRLQKSVVTLYDFGIVDSDYFIIMKKYPMSARKWRLMQVKHFEQMLHVYLRVFLKVLLAVKSLHNNNVTHYDLKCDNILLDPGVSDPENGELGKFSVSLADLGECKIFVNEEEETDFVNRGTECINSPEMIQLAVNNKKEGKHFDRRRRQGTTRATDIWSLGCLFYELLTGDFLFHDENWSRFFVRVTSNTQELINEDNKKKMSNNAALIEFLSYLLIRNPMHRPTIDHVIRRFKQLFSFISDDLCDDDELELLSSVSCRSLTPEIDQQQLAPAIDNRLEILQLNIEKGVYSDCLEKNRIDSFSPEYMLIIKQIALCTANHAREHRKELISKGFTHIISINGLLSSGLLLGFKYLLLKQPHSNKKDNIFKYIPRIFDFLRDAFIFKGKLLFVEDDCSSRSLAFSRPIFREVVLYLLTSLFQCSIYEMWSLINTQVIFFDLPLRTIQSLATLTTDLRGVRNLLAGFPRVSCICGCNTFYIKKSALKTSKVKKCRCSRIRQTNMITECPSDGCIEYMKFVTKKYQLGWKEIEWGYFSSKDFLVGPLYSGTVNDDPKIKLMLNSEGTVKNSMVYIKKINPESQYFYENADEWRLFSCKTCQMWVFGVENVKNKIVIPLNNLRDNDKQGILKFRSGPKISIKAPVLRKVGIDDIYG